MSYSSSDDDVIIVDVSGPSTSKNYLKSKEKDDKAEDNLVENVKGGSATNGDLEGIGLLIDGDIAREKADGTISKMKTIIEKK